MIYGSIKALESKTLIVFNSVFTSNTILSCFFLFLLIIDLYFFIPAMIPLIFILISELTISTETPTNEVNVDIEAQPLMAETKTKNIQSK